MTNPFNKLKSGIIIISIVVSVCGCSQIKEDGIYESYYRTGAVRTIEPYQNGKLDGIAREYYETGSLKHAIEYKQGKIDGIYNTYLPDGAVWKKAVYKQGRFLSKWEYDEEGFVVNQNASGH